MLLWHLRIVDSVALEQPRLLWADIHPLQEHKTSFHIQVVHDKSTLDDYDIKMCYKENKFLLWDPH